MKINLRGEKEALRKLFALETFSLSDIEKKQLVAMQNRSKKTGGLGATPVSPLKGAGQLRLSVQVGNKEIGYNKDYAPHVEYGHRTVDGGYVPGQRFLKTNKEIQEMIYIKDIIKRLKEV